MPAWAPTIYNRGTGQPINAPEWPQIPSPFPMQRPMPNMRPSPQIIPGVPRIPANAMGVNRPVQSPMRPMQPTSPLDAWRRQYFPGMSRTRRPQSLNYTPPGGILDENGNPVESFNQNNNLDLWNLNPLRQFAATPQQQNYYE